jgi:hypothetical protein
MPGSSREATHFSIASTASFGNDPVLPTEQCEQNRHPLVRSLAGVERTQKVGD